MGRVPEQSMKENAMDGRKWTTWAELKNEVMSPERQERLRQRALATENGALWLELQQLAAITPDDLAELAAADGGEARVVSVLRKHVEELGGNLEVQAVFGDHRVRLQCV